MKTLKLFIVTAIAILGLLASPIVKAQSVQLKPIDNLELKDYGHQFRQVFFEPENNHFLRFYMDPVDIKTGALESKRDELKEVAAEGAFTNGIIYGQDKDFKLGNLETPVAFFKDTLITVTLETAHTSIIKKYSISNGKMKLVQESGIREIRSLKRMKNGMYFSSDQYERNGSAIQFLNQEFKISNSYEPFPDGFESIEMADNGKAGLMIFMAPFSTETSQFITKLVFFDCQNGSILMERTYSKSEMDVIKIVASREYFYVYSSVAGLPANLWCFDLKGDMIWKKDMILPNLDITVLEDAKQLIAVTATKVMSLNMLSGAVMWQTSPVTFYHRNPVVKPSGCPNFGARVWSIHDLKSIGTGYYIGLVYCQSSGGIPKAECLKYENGLSLVNMKGELISEFNLEGQSSLLEVFVGKGKLWVITEKNFRSYEIINH